MLFTDSTNPGTWTPVALSQGADGAWTGGAPAPASGQIDYIVQAVDGDGNVAMDSNKGVEFTQVPESQVQSTGLGGLSASLSPAQNTESTYKGFYNGPVVVTFSGAPGATVTYQVDGGGSQTVSLGGSGQGSFTVTGDGTHVITASDTGNQISQVVKIDTTPPTISSSVERTALWQRVDERRHRTDHQRVRRRIGCGLAHLPDRGGSPTSVTGPITPPSGITTYDVSATDFLGNTSTATVTTQVDGTAPSSILCTPAVAPTSWFSTDQSVTCTGSDTQSGIAGGTSSTGSVTLSTSVPAGTANSNASTSSGQLCDNVGNCTPIPAISGFMIDKTAPVVSCPSAGTNWSTGTVSFTCTVTDSGSGLAAGQTGVVLNQAGTQATVTLTASAPAGSHQSERLDELGPGLQQRGHLRHRGADHRRHDRQRAADGQLSVGGHELAQGHGLVHVYGERYRFGPGRPDRRRAQPGRHPGHRHAHGVRAGRYHQPGRLDEFGPGL